LLGSGKGPEGERKNDVPDAFGPIGDTSPHVLVRNQVEELFFKIVRAQSGAFLRLAGWCETADIAVRRPVYLAGCRSD